MTSCLVSPTPQSRQKQVVDAADSRYTSELNSPLIAVLFQGETFQIGEQGLECVFVL